MMDYNKNACFEGACDVSEPVRESTLTEMQQKSTAMSEEILSMTRRISHHFFGIDNQELEEKNPVPECFRNDLGLDLQMQCKTIDVLQRMIAMIGT